MNRDRIIRLLVLWIALLAIVASAYGFFSDGGQGMREYVTVRGETVQIYGHGLYEYESVSMAAQARAQDLVTLVLGVPLLVLSLYLSRRNSLRGRILLTGTLGYFLYTYTTYTFVAMYNSFFLIYVLLMSASFFAFLLMMMSFEGGKTAAFREKLPARRIGAFLLFMSIMVGLMWLGKIVPPLTQGGVPEGLEHYTTLGIQGLDLSVLIPVQIVAAVLLIKRRSSGYLLSSILIIKLITLLTSLTAMIVGQAAAGVKMSVVEMSLFPLFNVIAILCLVSVLRNIREN
jgi:hypothetical protein